MSAYIVPPSAASEPENRFEFTMPDGNTYDVPKLGYLRPELAMRIVTTSEIEGAQILFSEFLPPGVFAMFEDTKQLEGLVNAWKEASGVSLGESEASASS